MNERREAAVDITNCDREPIHIPGAIQPHGVFLALRDPDFIVTQASENASTVFATGLPTILGEPLTSLLTADAFATVLEAANRENLPEANPLRILIGGRSCDAILHRLQGALILEIEPRVSAAQAERTHHPLRRVVSSLQAATTLADLLTAAAHTVRGVTGFERVMIYSFDEDGHGSVDAEAKSDGMDAYLGLHYPASDIPRQARELYLRNPIRNIPDARYTPVPLMPALRPDTGTPLDLSFAALRSVSPIHLEVLWRTSASAPR